MNSIPVRMIALSTADAERLSNALYAAEETAEANDDNREADHLAILNREVRMTAGLKLDGRLNAIARRGPQD